MTRRHDALCEAHGHDALCPAAERAVVPWKPNGQWPAGISGNAYGPKRLRAARALIGELSDNGRTIIERLFLMSGLESPHVQGRSAHEAFPSAVQARALKMLVDVFYGKQISVRGKVKTEVAVSGTVAHVGVSPEMMARLSDAALEKLEEAHRALLAEMPAPDAPRVDDVEDAAFEE